MSARPRHGRSTGPESRASSEPQAPHEAHPYSRRCAGCSAPGRVSTIRYEWAEPEPLPVLRFAYQWGSPPRTVLLCPRCIKRLERRRKRIKG